MNKNIIYLIIGLIIFALGGYQNIQYEEKALNVIATITNVKTVDDTDDGPISYKHTFYGKYTVDGKTYTNKNLETKYTSSHYPPKNIGDTIEIKVNPKNPGKKVAEGGLFIVVGVIMSAYNIYVLCRKKKAE